MKILVINIKYLGDLIVSTPGIKALRARYPEAEIVFMLRKEFVEVLAGNPYIDRIIPFDPEIKRAAGKNKRLTGLKFILHVRKEKFDVVVALHPGDRITLLSFLSGAKKRIGPTRQSLSFLLNKKVNVFEDSISYLDYYNRIFEALDLNVLEKRTEFFVDAEAVSWAKGFLEKNGPDSRILIGIHPGASEPTKIWDPQNHIELIKLLSESQRFRVLLIQGPQDKNYCEPITAACSNLLVYNSDSIKRTAALIKNCRLFLTHDTGTRHLSIALGVNTLALLPNDNLKWWNFYDGYSNYNSIIGARKEKSFLAGIPVNKVFNTITRLLEE